MITEKFLKFSKKIGMVEHDAQDNYEVMQETGKTFKESGLFRRHTNIQKNYLQYSYRITKNN